MKAHTMRTFRFSVTREDGSEINGTIDAITVDVALRKLRGKYQRMYDDVYVYPEAVAADEAVAS